ncbi:P-loop containing nucleoside triphosphate hydrolase protein [Neocallimastix sp. 'constans']|jgi:HrpA-like RNA helicase
MSSGRTDQFLTELTQYKKKLENFEPVEPLEYHVASLTPFERKYIPSACEKLGGIKCEKFGKGAEKIFKIVKVGDSLSHAEINKINQKKRKQQAEMPSLKIPNQLAYNLIDLSQQFQVYREQEKTYSYYNNHGLMDGYAVNYVSEYNFQDINYSTSTSNYNIEDTDITQNAFTDIRKKLPVYKMRKIILETIRNNQVTVISGNTGCGKSTQIPQYILEELLREGKPGTILVTQPRRISAITLADRVSQERCEYTGESVGYQIHLDSKKGPRTRLLYITVGILLRMLLDDENMAGTQNIKLRGITHVVVDEVHERNLLTDFSLIVLRDLLRSKRADLKLIVMSATLNAQLFSDYFSTNTIRTPILEIPGFTYPVQEFYLEDLLEKTGYLIPEDQHSENRFLRQGQNIRYNISRKPPATRISDPKFYDFWKNNYPNYSEETARSISYLRTDNSIIQKMLEWELELIAVTLRYIFEEQIFTGKVPDDVAILVFLPGWDDISRLQYILSQDPLFMDPNRCIVLPLHSSVSPEAQKKVFERPIKGQTKIVLATNIAETSVTIDDVVFVIDCGKHKEKIYDPVTNLSNLEVTWISKANSRQRMGRAGRVRNGYCYKLYTRSRYRSMADYQMAEILRTPLEEVCLQVKVLNLGKVSDFLSQAMEAPQELTVQQALQLLQVVGAIDKQENLTTLGRALALIPLNPRIGKMLIYGSLYHCLDPVLTIASGLSYRDPFVLTTQVDRDKARHVKLNFSMNSRSDHIALLNAFEQWDQSENKMQFCQDHFLNSSTMETMKEMKEHLKRLILNLFGIMNYNDEIDDPMIAQKIAKLNENSHNTELIKGIVLSGVYPNVAKIHLHIKNSNSQKKKANNDGKLKYLLAKSGQKVSIHPVSVCFGMKLEEFLDKSLDAEGNTVTHIKGADEGGYWLAFFDVMKNGGVKSSSMMRDTSVVDGLSVLLFGGGNHETEELDKSKVILKIDEGVQFMTDVITANAIINARQTMMDVIRWKIVNKKERMRMFSEEQLDYIDQVNDKIIEQVINIIEKKDFNLYDNSVYYDNGMMPMPEAKGQEYMMLPGNNAYASTAGYGYTTVTPVYPVMGYGVPGYRNSVMEQGVVKNSAFDDESVYSITESNESYSYYPASMYNSNSTFTSQTSLLKNNEVLDNWNNYDDTSSLQESQDTAVYHTNSPIPSQHSNSSSTANLSKANNNSQTTLSSYNNSNENVHKLDDHHTRTGESKESNTNTTTNRDSNISSQDKSSYNKNEINNNDNTNDNNNNSSSSINNNNNNNNKSNVKPYLPYIAPPLQQKYQRYSESKNMNSLNNNSNPSSPVIHNSIKQQQDMNERNYSRQSSRSSVSSTSNANVNNNINSHLSPLIHNNEDTVMTNQDSSSSAASSHRDENQQSFAKRRQSSDLERSYNSSGYESSSRSHQVNRDDFYNNSSYSSNSNNFYPSKKKHSSYIFGQNKNQNQYGNSGYSSYNNLNENPRNNNGNVFSNQNFRNNRNRYSDSNLVEQYQNSSYYNNGNNSYSNNYNSKKMGRNSYASSNGYNNPNNNGNNNNGMSMGMNNNNMNNMSRNGGGNYNSYRNSVNMGSFNNSKYNNNNYDSFNNNKQNRRSFNNQAYNSNNNGSNYYYNNSSNRNFNRYSQRYN